MDLGEDWDERSADVAVLKIAANFAYFDFRVRCDCFSVDERVGGYRERAFRFRFAVRYRQVVSVGKRRVGGLARPSFEVQVDEVALDVENDDLEVRAIRTALQRAKKRVETHFERGNDYSALAAGDVIA